MTNVVIIEAQIKKYRAPFYALLDEALCGEGIRLTVAYSDPPAAEAGKNDTCELPPPYGLKVSGYWLVRDRLLYQPLFGPALNSDLVIVDQGNRFLLNHILLPLSRLGLRRVAFWGHGRSPQSGAILQWYKRKTLNWATWWFAYTRGTARYLESEGVPGPKITAVQNSVDTRKLREQVRNCQNREAIRSRLGIPPQAPIGIFCGMLEKVKNVPFLVASSKMIKERVPNFHLLIVGGGPEQNAIAELVQGLPWIHMVGPRFGNEKAEFMAISDASMLPGAVGLAILDAFAAGLPLLTTRLKIHGPEIEYLEEDVNGLMTEPDPQAYAETVYPLVLQQDRLNQLKAGAQASAAKYSIENMVANFQTGIKSCLGLSSSRAEVPGRSALRI